MAIQVKFDASQVAAALNQQASPAVVTAGLEALARVLVNRVRLGFRFSREPSGAPWRPLKRRKGKPLVDTGRLRSSITSRVVGNGVEIGTSVVYARPHQFGMTMKKGGKLPARPFLPLTPSGDVALPPGWAASALNAMGQAMQL